MEKSEIDADMENLLNKMLEKDELKLMKTIIENRGRFNLKEGK